MTKADILIVEDEALVAADLGDRLREMGIGKVLTITPAHAYAMLSIPRIHGDPFDRLLAAQCVVERMHLVSADRIFRKYPIELVW